MGLVISNADHRFRNGKEPEGTSMIRDQIRRAHAGLVDMLLNGTLIQGCSRFLNGGLWIVSESYSANLNEAFARAAIHERIRKGSELHSSHEDQDLFIEFILEPLKRIRCAAFLAEHFQIVRHRIYQGELVLVREVELALLLDRKVRGVS